MGDWDDFFEDFDPLGPAPGRATPPAASGTAPPRGGLPGGAPRRTAEVIDFLARRAALLERRAAEEEDRFIRRAEAHEDWLWKHHPEVFRAPDVEVLDPPPLPPGTVAAFGPPTPMVRRSLIDPPERDPAAVEDDAWGPGPVGHEPPELDDGADVCPHCGGLLSAPPSGGPLPPGSPLPPRRQWIEPW